MRPNAFQKPLRTVWNVANHATESLWWPAAAQKEQQRTKTVLLFVCGNPGLVEYYTDFLNAIYEQAANPYLEIVGVSHLGHSLGPHASGPQPLYGLQEQIDHKIACLDLLRSENPSDTQYILMGHSMGSYVCAEVLKQRQQHNIIRLIALFPTLREIALTPNGVTLSRSLFRVPLPIVSGVVGLASLIPGPIRQSLTGLITGQKGNGLKVTAHGLMHASVVKNVVHMARQEMELIKELDDDFYATHVDKFIMYYSRNDQWAPLDHYEFMTEKFPNAQVHLCAEDIPHAFIIVETSRRALALLQARQHRPSSGEDAYRVDIIGAETLPTKDQLNQMASYLHGWQPLVSEQRQPMPSTMQDAQDILLKDPEALKRPIVVDWSNGKAAVGDASLDTVEALIKHRLDLKE
ncbi:hypothetical protein [Absidia glauca]|uniref:AB hydrolase-1 domain-containing protein n=1 Tax=Absidia glauca TaxID=4829 RepID=A0A168MVP5_ABSGL|nr:hypothetical protein [Absidia glauca]